MIKCNFPKPPKKKNREIKTNFRSQFRFIFACHCSTFQTLMVDHNRSTLAPSFDLPTKQNCDLPFQTNQNPWKLPWSLLSTVAPIFDRGYPDHAGKLPWPPPASQLPTKKPSLWLFFSCARWVWEQGDRSNDGRRRRKLELTGGASDLGGGDWWKGEPEVARFLERNLIWESLAWSDWLTIAVKRMISTGVWESEQM